MTPFVQRMLLSLLPAAVLVALASIAVWGESGVMARERLQAQLDTARGEHASLDRDNQRLIRELRLMQRDPVLLERLVADELGMAREGSTVVRFR